MYIHRTLDLSREKKSCFLFGPRQTGKSTLLRKVFPHALRINLLESDTFLKYSKNPEMLRKELRKTDRHIIVDEIQKAPHLLDEIQLLIDEHNVRFTLTGSSARKLRRSSVNLLGGRARSYSLHPFTSTELGSKFDLLKALSFGTLPPIWESESPRKDLAAYCGDYLQNEIALEGLTRNIPAFGRFLESAALMSGQLINYQSLADQSSVAKSTVAEYFKILQDTLIAFEVRPWTKGKKRKPIQTPKFYFFDVGVTRSIQKRGKVNLHSADLGEAFENWMAHELKAYLDYLHSPEELCYWRSTSQFEVDFILQDIAIEVKAKSKLSKHDFRGLEALSEEEQHKDFVLACFVEKPFREGKITVLPWQELFDRLYSGASLSKL